MYSVQHYFVHTIQNNNYIRRSKNLQGQVQSQQDHKIDHSKPHIAGIIYSNFTINHNICIKMHVMGGTIVQPDIHNVASYFGEELAPRSGTLTFNAINSPLLSFNTSHNVLRKWFYCDSPSNKRQSIFLPMRLNQYIFCKCNCKTNFSKTCICMYDSGSYVFTIQR